MARLKDNIYKRKQKLKAKKEKKFVLVKKVVLFIVLVVVLVSSFKIYQSIRRSSWQDDSRFNVVFDSLPVLIASFGSYDHEVNFLLIPEGTFIETTHGYGSCRAESISRLGKINNRGGEFLSESLQNYLGLPLDSYILSSSSLVFENNPTSLKSYLLANFSFFSRVREEASLNNWDLLRLWWYLKKANLNKFNIINLSDTPASEEITLADGSKAIKIDPNRLELLITQFFSDNKIKEEDLSISILNSTEHAGLASQMANLIKNIGGQIIKIGEVTTVLKSDDYNCEIRSAKEYKNSYTVRKISKIFNCRWTGDDLLSERSSLVIIVKENYWKLLNLP